MNYIVNKTSTLNDDQLRLLPDANEVNLYEQRGWHVTPKILSDALIDEALEGARAFHDGIRDNIIMNKEKLSDPNSATGKILLNNELTSLQKVEIKKLVNDPMISATAARLSNSKQIRLFSDCIVHKKPMTNIDTGVVGWHSDRAYWPTCTSHKMLTAWIPLQDCTIEMGPVFYIEGSHKWYKDSKINSFFNFNNQNLSDLSDFLEIKKPNSKKVPMNIKKGQVSFHNAYTIHASKPNKSNIDRIAVGIHLQDGENQYQKAFKEDGTLIKISYDYICKKDQYGNPDYSDPNIFPLLFEDK